MPIAGAGVRKSRSIVVNGTFLCYYQSIEFLCGYGGKMTGRKTLQDLTIKDNFMFGAVMSVEENCIGFLELVLGIEIERIVISKEKSIMYHPEYKGVRLDIYARDENNTHYDVEMQVKPKDALGKRARYYHSQMDTECLASGVEYEMLPKSFVIFICDFDPFGKERYVYTFCNCCLEEGALRLEDGTQTIFLSTKGKNYSEVPKELVEFLEFVGANVEESEKDYGNSLVRQMQRTIRGIKTNREIGERYMLLQELLRDEKREGRAEGRLEAMRDSVLSLLEEIGEIPEELRKEIEEIDNLDFLKTLHKKAARAESVEMFVTEMKKLLEMGKEKK